MKNRESGSDGKKKHFMKILKINILKVPNVYLLFIQYICSDWTQSNANMAITNDEIMQEYVISVMVEVNSSDYWHSMNTLVFVYTL